MKQHFVQVVAALFGVILLSGCGPADWAGEKAGEKIMEKAIETQTGGKVDVNTKDNTMNITTNDGQMQYSAGGEVTIPDNFPKELIVVDDAKFILATSSKDSATVAYTTNDDQTAVFNTYKSNLAGAGWNKELEMNAGGSMMLNFSKGSEKVSITGGANNNNDQPGKTMVQVVLVQETAQEGN